MSWRNWLWLGNNADTVKKTTTVPSEPFVVEDDLEDRRELDSISAEKLPSIAEGRVRNMRRFVAAIMEQLIPYVSGYDDEKVREIHKVARKYSREITTVMETVLVRFQTLLRENEELRAQIKRDADERERSNRIYTRLDDLDHDLAEHDDILEALMYAREELMQLLPDTQFYFVLMPELNRLGNPVQNSVALTITDAWSLILEHKKTSRGALTDDEREREQLIEALRKFVFVVPREQSDTNDVRHVVSISPSVEHQAFERDNDIFSLSAESVRAIFWEHVPSQDAEIFPMGELGRIVLFSPQTKEDNPKEDLNFLFRWLRKIGGTLGRMGTQERGHFDPLTKMLTRGPFLMEAELRLSECTDETPMTMVMFDLDKFKLVNDTYWHPMGDMVIRKSAEKMRGGIRLIGNRWGDLLGRYGGEEILALLESDIEGAVKIVERILMAIASITFWFDAQGNATCEEPGETGKVAPDSPRFHVTASAGMVSTNKPFSIGTKGVMIQQKEAGNKNVSDLIAGADRRLYITKEFGRDGITIGETSESYRWLWHRKY